MNTAPKALLHAPSIWVGLTGGIGSGKSTVANMLATWGARVLDADHISRTLTSSQGVAMSDIERVFGPHMITDDGALDREKMRTLVFSDQQARSRLEAILHPLVESSLLEQADLATQEGIPVIVFDVPLLAQSKRWQERVDRILVIDCSEDTQVKRVQKRSQIAPEQIRQIIQAQASREDRCALADWVIFNEHLSLTQLQEKAKIVFQEALSLTQN